MIITLKPNKRINILTPLLASNAPLVQIVHHSINGFVHKTTKNQVRFHNEEKKTDCLKIGQLVILTTVWSFKVKPFLLNIHLPNHTAGCTGCLLNPKGNILTNICKWSTYATNIDKGRAMATAKPLKISLFWGNNPQTTNVKYTIPVKEQRSHKTLKRELKRL